MGWVGYVKKVGSRETVGIPFGNYGANSLEGCCVSRKDEEECSDGWGWGLIDPRHTMKVL